jgi:cell division protein FtsW (lipid II flippase)
VAWAYTDKPEPMATRAGRLASDLLQRGGPAWLVVLASVLLSLLGLLGIHVAEAGAVDGLGPLAKRQLAYLAMGLCVGAGVACVHYRKLGAWVWGVYLASLALLVFLLVPFVPSAIVRPRGGARSWIDLGPLNFQPSELTKIACFMALAWYLRYRKNHRTLRGLLPPALITGVPMALIILQPDLGTAILFVPMLFFVLIAAGAKLKHLVLVVALATMCAPAAYPLLKPHQKQRIAGLVMQIRGDRTEDLDINMQSVTSQRLIGAGGIVGVGEDRARTMHKFNALPERHNDMVFAPIVTRHGLLGGIGLLGLYALWVLGALWTSARCDEPFARLICVGATGFLFAQVMVNLGMNLGLLPIIGITLPYVSHGGSSMLAQWAIVGLILGVALRRQNLLVSRSFEWGEDQIE